MRFVFNFIFFGLLFYIIWFYFPEAFQTLVSGASSVYQFLHDLVVAIVDKVRQGTGGKGAEQESLLLPIVFLAARYRG